MQHLFVYGTLLLPEIRKGLTGKSFKTEKAILNGFKRCGIYGCDYPALIPAPDSNVQGQLVFDIDKKSMEILSLFEGIDYELIEVEVFIRNKKEKATLFVWKSDLEYLGDQDWDKNIFEQHSLSFYLNKIIPETLKEFNKGKSGLI
ncbi:gamma-glutamylcyclotransferase [Draconibacterium sp.]|nr:gamma-glutamylcyclotransferase [Draconibacterium sp.]